MLATRMDPAFLDTYLRDHDDKDVTTSDAWLPIDTLGALAKRGNDQAVGILRAYVAVGYHVRSALDELADTEKPDAWRGLDLVLSARFQDPQALDCQAQIRWVPLDKAPWNDWARSPTLVGELLRDTKQSEGEKGEVEEADYSAMTTAQVLDVAEGQRKRRGLAALNSRNSDEDAAVLLPAIDIRHPWRALAALRALGPRRDPRVYEPARRIVEEGRFNWRDSQHHPIMLRAAAADALAVLAAGLVLPLAREWRSSHRWKFRRSGIDILERHATQEDIPWIIRQLRRPVTHGRAYAFCDYMQMLARFPEHGPFPVVRRIFREFPYSFGRKFIADALAKTDPEFPSDRAYECLWDCEDSVRIIGCQSVDMALSNARNRLEELARDEFEDEDVRGAARSRLDAPHAS